ncbi:hypothetical protein Tco_0896303 [Tanacetum coccineum]
MSVCRLFMNECRFSYTIVNFNSVVYFIVRCIIFSCDLKKMAPKRTTRSTPAATATTTNTVTDAQLKVLIDQGVANALAARDAGGSRNGEDNHD